MVAAMFHQLVNIDIASEDADTLPQNRKSRPSRCRSDSGEADPGPQKSPWTCFSPWPHPVFHGGGFSSPEAPAVLPSSSLSLLGVTCPSLSLSPIQKVGVQCLGFKVKQTWIIKSWCPSLLLPWEPWQVISPFCLQFPPLWNGEQQYPLGRVVRIRGENAQKELNAFVKMLLSVRRPWSRHWNPSSE